jgi:cell division septal protein FtsQ
MIAVIAVMFAVGYLSSVISTSKFFTVRSVKTDVEITPEIENMMLGKSLFKVNTKGIYNAVTAMYPEYKNVHIIKQFPSQVRIEVNMRKPVAQIKGDLYYRIDKEGYILDDGQDTRYSKLIPIEIARYNRGLKKGSQISDERLTKALELIKLIKKSTLPDKYIIDLVNPTSLAALYFVVDNTKVILGKGNFDKKLKIFNNLLKEKFNDNLSSVEYVDLRYKKVYVGYRR